VQYHVRALFKNEFEVEHDEDFIAHETADAQLVCEWRDGQGSGPNPEGLHFDMRAGPDSEWNSEILRILLSKLKKRRAEESWDLPDRSDSYYLGLLQAKYKHARNACNAGQPKNTHPGQEESPEDVEMRLVLSKDIGSKRARTNKRRIEVSLIWNETTTC